MRAARVIVVLIIVNVFLFVFAASVILSPEFAAVDGAVRKGKAAPPPKPEVVRAIAARPGWQRELLPRRASCGLHCRMRGALILWYFSEDELLRAYAATH